MPLGYTNNNYLYNMVKNRRKISLTWPCEFRDSYSPSGEMVPAEINGEDQLHNREDPTPPRQAK